MLFWGWIIIWDLYLFHFIVLLNSDFNCSKSFISFSFDQLTTGTYTFASVILDSNPVGATIVGLLPQLTLFLDQVKINSTSQLMIGIFKLFQKLLKYFSFLPTLFASYLGLSF